MIGCVLLIEDDQIQADDLRYRLAKRGIDTHTISTESQFCKHIHSDDFPAYSLAVVDMMLRWADPHNMEAVPSEVMDEGAYTAGLRCCRKLKARGVRCIIFTALSPTNIMLRPGDGFEVVHKGGDGYALLLRAILTASVEFH